MAGVAASSMRNGITDIADAGAAGGAAIDVDAAELKCSGSGGGGVFVLARELEGGCTAVEREDDGTCAAAVGVTDRDRFIGDTRRVIDSADVGVVLTAAAMQLVSLSPPNVGGGVFIKSLFALRDVVEYALVGTAPRTRVRGRILSLLLARCCGDPLCGCHHFILLLRPNGAFEARDVQLPLDSFPLDSW